jgi:hypothetical protein
MNHKINDISQKLEGLRDTLDQLTDVSFVSEMMIEKESKLSEEDKAKIRTMVSSGEIQQLAESKLSPDQLKEILNKRFNA